LFKIVNVTLAEFESSNLKLQQHDYRTEADYSNPFTVKPVTIQNVQKIKAQLKSKSKSKIQRCIDCLMAS